MVTVTVVYGVSAEFGVFPALDEVITAVARRHGLEWDGSGSGAGERDHTFTARNRGQAKAFKLAIKQSIPRARIAIHGGCR